MMNYALLQKSLELPPVDSLKRAFRAVPHLTDTDAHTLARDAFGILVRRQSAEQATRVQQALLSEGVETEIAAESSLPQLPPTKFVSRVDCLQDAMILYDPLGRKFPLEWQHIMLVAAGNVRMQEFNRIRQERKVTRYNARGHRQEVTEVDYTSREESTFRLLLEVVLSRAVLRYTIQVDSPVLFSCLGERRTKDSTRNFALLVQDICRSAPHAAVNRGAYYFREDAPEPFPYPSKNAFHEEITWLLWRLAQRPNAS